MPRFNLESVTGDLAWLCGGKPCLPTFYNVQTWLKFEWRDALLFNCQLLPTPVYMVWPILYRAVKGTFLHCVSLSGMIFGSLLR